MPRHRPLLFTVRYSERPFRGRHWYVSGFKGEKRIQLWFRSEKEAKAAAANRNAEIKAHGTQVSLSPVDRIQAIAAAEKLAPYGKSILEAADFLSAQSRESGEGKEGEEVRIDGIKEGLHLLRGEDGYLSAFSVGVVESVYPFEWISL